MRDESDPATLAGRELGERLRREVDDLATGLPPVSEVMREGRRMRRRRHLAVTTACLVAVSLPLTVAAFPALLPGGSDEESASAGAGGSPRVVEPYERIDVGHGLAWSLGLQPAHREGYEAGQGYVLCRTDDFEVAVEQLADDENPRVAGDGRGDDLSGFLSVTSGATIVSGTWRTASGRLPGRVVISWGAHEVEATLLRTRDARGWGVYYAVLDGTPQMVETVFGDGGLTQMIADVRVELVAEAEQGDPLATIWGEDLGSDSQIAQGDEYVAGPLSLSE
jgi:hypothetical protein